MQAEKIRSTPRLQVIANNLTTSSITKNDKEVGKVYETLDYSKFSFFKGNRPINSQNLKKLNTSILKIGQLQSIIVDRLFKIADGQHRFEVLKNLNWPIRYEIRSDIDIKRIQEMQSGKSWAVVDFLKYYTNSEDENQNVHYKLYHQFMDEFKLGHNMTLALICGTYSNSVPTNEFKDGTLKVNQSQFEKARKEARMIYDFSKYHKKFKKRAFILAILTLLKKVKGYNHEIMIDKVSKYSAELLDHNRTAFYVKNLIDIYNKYTPKTKALVYRPEDVIPG